MMMMMMMVVVVVVSWGAFLQTCLIMMVRANQQNPRETSCDLNTKVIFALNQTLLQQESLRAGGLQMHFTTEHLIKHYNCGDLNSIIFSHDTSQVPSFKNVTLPASEQVTAQEIEHYFRQELIYKRNERMGRRVRALLEEHPHKSFFFAFGAGHFLGNNSVIDVLRREGYEVEHTPAGQTLHRRSEELLDVDAPLEPFLHESRGLQEDEDSNPRLLELLEKVEHKLKKKQRRRQFNELWVRMEESVTAQAPPPVVRIINGYSTVQTHPQEHGRANQHRTCSGSASCRPHHQRLLHSADTPTGARQSQSAQDVLRLLLLLLEPRPHCDGSVCSDPAFIKSDEH